MEPHEWTREGLLVEYTGAIQVIEELEARVAHLQTWGGLMETLDKLYPPEIITGRSGYAAPTIIVLLRLIHRLRQEGLHTEGQGNG